MKKVLPLLLVGLLSACTVGSYKSQQTPPVATIEQSEVASSSDESPASQEWQSVVLTDRDYDVRSNGAQWLKDIGTQLAQGNVSQARLQIDLSRGNDDKGWSAIGMYIAPLAQGEGFVYPNESVYGTNLHFINAVWRGDCARHLAPTSSFGVLKEHSNHLTVDLAAVPVTAKDPCDTSSVTLNLLQHLSDGLYIGFMPSNRGYHAKVTLEYVGDLTAKPF
jgi:hypothetical protein